MGHYSDKDIPERRSNCHCTIPRDPTSPILTGELIGRIILVSALLLAGAFGLFIRHQREGGSIEEARTIAVNVFVMGELFYLFNCRSLTKSMFAIGFFSNPWVIVGPLCMMILQLIFTYVPQMNAMFHSAPIGLYAWGKILFISLAIHIIVGIEKWIRRRFEAQKPRTIPFGKCELPPDRE